MSPAPRTTPSLAPWELLQRDLAGRFRARARGLLGAEFSLFGPEGGEEFGRLRMRGALGATFRAGGAETEIERGGPFAARYRMSTGGAPVLLASPAGPDGGLRVFCGGKTYEARWSVLRNTATAHLLSEFAGSSDEMVRLEGGLAGRSYEASLPEEDGGALAVAVFMLYRSVALRRQAF